jgi:hypothetical protein
MDHGNCPIKRLPHHAGPGRFSLSYCVCVRFRYTPPRPLMIADSNICLLSRLAVAPPSSASSRTLSAEAKVSFLGKDVFRSVSRNWQYQPRQEERHVDAMARLGVLILGEQAGESSTPLLQLPFLVNSHQPFRGNLWLKGENAGGLDPEFICRVESGKT